MFISLKPATTATGIFRNQATRSLSSRQRKSLPTKAVCTDHHSSTTTRGNLWHLSANNLVSAGKKVTRTNTLAQGDDCKSPGAAWRIADSAGTCFHPIHRLTFTIAPFRYKNATRWAAVQLAHPGRPLRAFSTTSSNRKEADGDRLKTKTNYKTVLVTKPNTYVASVELNRPESKNAFGLDSAAELVELFGELELDPGVRCVVLSGQGPHFTSGVDIKSFMGLYSELQEISDIARRAKLLRRCVEQFQAPFKAMQAFGKPIVCVQHGLSLGLSMELAACCDVRYCSRDTRMAIREVLIGIAADVGSLQLLPRMTANQSLLHELIYTGRYLTVDEARELGFVSRVLETKEDAMGAALELAATIARRSPVAVQGSKRNLQFSRESSFRAGLDYNAVWNAAMMQGEDVVKAIGGILAKQKEDEIEYEDF